MSVDYSIDLETDLDLVEVSDLIDKVGIHWNSSGQEFENTISKACDFFYLGITRISAELGRLSGVSRQTNAPKFSIVMSWKNYTDETIEATFHMVEILAYLMKALKGDMVFDYEGTAYLIRRSGQVLLSKEHNFWGHDPRRLEFIPTPYEWVEKLP